MPNLFSRGVFNLFFGARRKAFASLPGPAPGVLGTLGDFLGATPWDVCARYGREYGGVTLIWMGASPGVVLNDPSLIEEVMETRRLEFEKGAISDQVRPTVTDDTVFIAKQSEDWAEKRRGDPLEQPWSPEWLAAQVGPMQATVAQAVEHLFAAGPVDLTPVLRRLTFDTFATVVVGEALPDSAYDDFMLMAKGADARIQAKLPLRFVSLPKGFERARERFYGLFAQKVRAARAKPNPHGVDLLSWTLRQMPDLPEQRLAHLLGTFFYGGVFSSSTTLVGAFHQLQRFPDAEARLAAEAAALGEGPWTFESLRQAPWAEAVAYESMRLLPAVRVFTRTPAADAKLAGVTLPAGAMIMISNQHLHRDPTHWVRAEEFVPERWLGGGVARDPLGSGYFFPFGRGPRACVGGAFAVVYLQTALATIAARARVQVDSTAPFEEGFFFGVVLPKGVIGRLQARPPQSLQPPGDTPAVESA
ncbi:cytochrome P450 [Corallococcus sp. H22C18031201]|uniref:cytochrome P450 n=1 Tax=Citreicoccus inhibens TaxID=2849499 RepID=UPI000E753574|nr:cytochrome P450 [Citreicoccus inhibens]MBU8894237.1 cytochrome P450 [Citreicoccus inhibens]RJS23069.1 cytochrome P450 [Corallococcus sp. H22C18031201]